MPDDLYPIELEAPDIAPYRAGNTGTDGDRPIATPYDDCVLVMPSRRLRRGESAVRFGCFVAPP